MPKAKVEVGQVCLANFFKAVLMVSLPPTRLALDYSGYRFVGIEDMHQMSISPFLLRQMDRR